MNKSESIKELAKALAQFQGKVETIQKNKKVKVKTKNGGEYEFPYADYEAIVSAIKPVMLEFGLSFTQLVASEGLHTMLLHSSGEYLESLVSLNMNQKPQELGSEITYKRRYALSAVLGLATDDDDDGNWSSGNEIKQTQIKQQPDKPWFNEDNFAESEAEFTRLKQQGMTSDQIVKEVRQQFAVSRDMANSITLFVEHIK